MAFLIRLARARPAGKIIPWILRHMSRILPVDVLYETESLTAFFHPQPEYPIHILIVPKYHITGLASIQETDHAFLQDLFRCVRVLVSRFGLERDGYRLVANGGSYQEVKLLHFHLLSEDTLKVCASIDQLPNFS